MGEEESLGLAMEKRMHPLRESSEKREETATRSHAKEPERRTKPSVTSVPHSHGTSSTPRKLLPLSNLVNISEEANQTQLETVTEKENQDQEAGSEESTLDELLDQIRSLVHEMFHKQVAHSSPKRSARRHSNTLREVPQRRSGRGMPASPVGILSKATKTRHLRTFSSGFSLLSPVGHSRWPSSGGSSLSTASTLASGTSSPQSQASQTSNFHIPALQLDRRAATSVSLMMEDESQCRPEDSPEPLFPTADGKECSCSGEDREDDKENELGQLSGKRVGGLLDCPRRASNASVLVSTASDFLVPEQKKSRMRNWFFSRKQKHTLAECDLGHLVFLLTWYPQYVIALLTRDEIADRQLQKSLCGVLFAKLFYAPQKKSSHAYEHALDLIFWHVLCSEFTFDNKMPLRTNGPAEYLLTEYIKEPECNGPVQALLAPILAPLLEEEMAERIEGFDVAEFERLAIQTAERVLEAFLSNCESIFPKRMYQICSQILLLASSRDIVAIVGGNFLMLRLISPAVVSFRNTTGCPSVMTRTARFLQMLCGPGRDGMWSADEQAYYERNRPRVKELIEKMCTKHVIAKSFDMVNQYMLTRALLLDMERCIDKPYFDGMANETSQELSVLLSTADVQILVKCALVLQERLGNSSDKMAMKRYCEPHMRFLEAIVNDQQFAQRSAYMQVYPAWFFAPFSDFSSHVGNSHALVKTSKQHPSKTCTPQKEEGTIRATLEGLRSVIYAKLM